MSSKLFSRAICISDAHLGAPIETCELREQFLRAFLCDHVAQMQTLFIVGDLFDFWVEYRYAIRPDYFKTLCALNEVVKAGVDVHYIAGNHDFALGKFLTSEVGVHVHCEHYNTEVFGKKVHFYHGDGIIRADWPYRLLKKILRNPVNQYMYKMLHPNIGVRMATFFSGSSRKLMALRINQARLAEYRAGAFALASAYRSDLVIMGHTHIAEVCRKGSVLYANSGQWIRKYDFLKIDESGVSTCEYLPNGTAVDRACELWPAKS